ALSPLPRAYCRVAGTDSFIAPRDPIFVADDSRVQISGGVSAIVDAVPLGTGDAGAGDAVRPLMLSSDVVLGGPAGTTFDLAAFQARPFSAFSPVAITPDELGDAWAGGRIDLPLQVGLNGKPHGRTEAGPVFAKLVAQAART